MFAFLHLRNAGRVKAARRWPTAVGRVLTSRVEPAGQGARDGFRARIVYGYDVAGVTRTSERVRFGGVEGAATDAQRLVERYPAGSAPTVSYDPADPEHAVLELGSPNPMLLVFAVAGLALTLVGAVLMGR